MHTYRVNTEADHTFWEVGYYLDYGHIWNTVKGFATEDEAAMYVNYLNGGHGLLPGV